MHYLVTYDVNTQSKAGRRRLRQIAKACEGYGQRVQFSVFECDLSEERRERLRRRLTQIIDPEEDSVRIYRLPGNRQQALEVLGLDHYVDLRAPLIV